MFLSLYEVSCDHGHASKLVPFERTSLKSVFRKTIDSFLFIWLSLHIDLLLERIP